MLAAACDKESALLHKQQGLLAKSLQAAREELTQLKGGRQAQMMPISPTQSEEVGHSCCMKTQGEKQDYSRDLLQMEISHESCQHSTANEGILSMISSMCSRLGHSAF